MRRHLRLGRRSSLFLSVEWGEMKNRGTRIRNPKLRGEWAELCFMARAAEHGLQVNKPWGEMARFDFVVGHLDHFLRVQVKSTTARLGRGYQCTVRGGHRPYVGNVFDFLAIYVIPEDLWYIIPAEKIRGQGCVVLSPHIRNSKYENCKEAWDRLRTPTSAEATIPFIHACVDEFFPPVEDGSFVSGHGFSPGAQNSKLTLAP